MNEQHHHIHQPEQNRPGGTRHMVDAWEHPPEHGPAVLVVDTAVHDRSGQRWGQWIDPTQHPLALERSIEDTVGIATTEQNGWAVLDQVRLGGTMIPEQLSVHALHRFAAYRTAQQPETTPLENAGSITELLDTLPSDRWDDASDLARDIIIATGLLPALDGLPDDWETYIDINLDKLGADAARAAGLTVRSDGEIARSGDVR